MDANLLHIDPALPDPIYRQIVEQIRRLTSAGQLRPGDALPSVRDVAAAHAINPMTVSRAYSQLENEGVLVRLRGKGMSVAARSDDGSDIEARMRLLDPVLREAARHCHELELSVDRVLARLRQLIEEKTPMNAVAFAHVSTQPDLALPLQAQGLHLAYGQREVLRGVDLDLPAGEVLGLIGRNGAGKSSLIGCLTGLLRPQSGQARLMGAPALQLDDARKQQLGYVPQQPQAFGWMRIGQLFDYLSQLYPQWDGAHAAALLERFALTPDRAIGKLSPGEAQRLAVVRALAPRPALLVLDEPASALDPVARRELLREIVAQAADSGTTVLFSSHIVSDLERIASRVAFLHEGRILLDQPLDTVKDSVVRLRVPAEAASRLPARLPGELSRRTHADGAIGVVIAGEDGWQALLQVDGVRVDRLGLEDLFVEVAG